MPELPEVQTTVNGINTVAKNRKIIDIWTDFNSSHKMFLNTIKNTDYFKSFKQKIINTKIIKAERKAKNILIHLNNKETILIHLKMTGHIMYGKYEYNKKQNKWTPQKGQKYLEDSYNRFIHLVFVLDNNKHLVLSDTRKFAKILLLDDNNRKQLDLLGPEPLSPDFTFSIFKNNINKHSNKYIKTVLMKTETISGIGNIYSDEILHKSKILPNRKVSSLNEKELKEIYKNIKILLNKGIELGGDSMSDYRNIYGQKGGFQNTHKVYRRNKEKCLNKSCDGIIQRQILDGRSSHFCIRCQK